MSYAVFLSLDVQYIQINSGHFEIQWSDQTKLVAT